jgi:hypothetical protein
MEISCGRFCVTFSKKEICIKTGVRNGSCYACATLATAPLKGVHEKKITKTNTLNVIFAQKNDARAHCSTAPFSNQHNIAPYWLKTHS